ncbi:MAG TPA: M42 family metallopeptidase [Armatimonadetes bacterium]|jgi:putative aminopeptidase FrvX|nr:M42 family metallopeptidase [Armatimonadota bacterium]
MRDDSLAFLRRLLEAPSPSGYERPAQDVVRDWVGSFADEVRTDVHGNVIAAVNPSGRPRVMLAGHCDQIGLMVQHIDDDGYLYVNQIGGHDITVLIGQNVVVWSKSGPVPGVMARKPIHLMKDDEEKKPPKIHDLWVDIGATNKQEALEAVEIGDPITWSLGMRTLRNSLAASPAFDDKAGVYVVMEALRLLSEQQPSAAILAVSTVQEEIGLRGAVTSTFAVEPQVGIAVDVTFATDHPGADKKVCGDVSLNKGPAIHRGPNMNPVVVSRLIAAAQEKGIPYQLVGSARATGTDANVMQISRGGVATGLVSVPNRYMHSPVETVSLRDMQHAAELLAAFVLKVETDAEFIP